MAPPALESCEDQINWMTFEKKYQCKKYKIHAYESGPEFMDSLCMQQSPYWEGQLLVLVSSQKAASSFALKTHSFLFSWLLLCGRKMSQGDHII